MDANAFHKIVQNGSLEKLKQALNDGVNVNAHGHVGQTALMVAIAAHDLAKMELLLVHGADPELTDAFHGTALTTAVKCDFADGVRCLLNLNVQRVYRPNYPAELSDAPTVAHMISQVESVDVLKQFLELGDDLNLVVGQTPIYKLKLESWEIEAVKTSGDMPSWLHRHRSKYEPKKNLIHVQGGNLQVRDDDGGLATVPNEEPFELDLSSFRWRRS